MRAQYTLHQAALLLAVACVAEPASADPCFDASDEARALLGRRRLLDARAQLRLCAASSCDDSVRVLCDDRLAEVTARLPTIIFDVKDLHGHDLPDVALTVDGAPYADGAQGAEITLDPGQHVFVFSLPNEEPLEQRFVLVEREKGRREHIVVERQRERAGALPLPVAAPERAAASPAPPSATPFRTAGWITLGASAVGIGIGTAFGISAIVKNDDARCDSSNVCEDPRSRHDSRIAANVSTASFIVGGALAATGVALLLFNPAPRSKSAGATVVFTSAAGGGSLGFTKRW